jgi:Cd2+/Zn2+-exporting ATPase
MSGQIMPAAVARSRFRLNSCCAVSTSDLDAVRALPGVAEVQLFGAVRLVVVAHDGVSDEAILQAAATRGVTLLPEAPRVATTQRAWWHRPELFNLAAAAVLLATALILEHLLNMSSAAVVFFVGTVVVGGMYPLRHAIEVLRARRFTIGVLLVAVAIGALILGRFGEAAVLVVAFTLGEVLEGFAADRARGSIRALMALAPIDATRRRPDGHTEVVPVEALARGDMVLVRPGERLPTDGHVSAGASWVDQSPVTGESMPVEVLPGSTVFGGSVNGAGALELQVTAIYQDTVLARIVREVEQAQAHQGRAQRFADRFGAIYTPTMFGLAGAVVLLGPVFGLGWSEAFYRGLVVLVVSCSCALVISVPVTVVSGIARAARDGILIKGGAYLEALARVDTIAFDKTGTLTQGRPALTAIVAIDEPDENRLLTLAASIEALSEHPVASAVVAAAQQRGLSLLPASNVTAQPGVGITGSVAGRQLHLGRLNSAKHVHRLATEAIAKLEGAGFTPIVIIEHGDAADKTTRILGVLGVADQPRSDAPAAVAALRELGIHRLVMLTGDNQRVADRLAHQLGLEDVLAELLPADKTTAVAELKRAGHTVAMVGDGINDAPAMATADVAVAMGSAGTAVALETAGLALMADDLTRLPAAIRLARRARVNITQNIALSLASITVLVVAALTGGMNLTAGVLLNEGSALLIIANGLRMLGARGVTVTRPVAHVSPSVVRDSAPQTSVALQCCPCDGNINTGSAASKSGSCGSGISVKETL